MSVSREVKRITTHVLQEMKQKGEKIAMLTAYDYSLAKIVDASGIDIILVGDSASNVMAGHETTLPITLDQMIYHASSVVRAVKKAMDNIGHDAHFWGAMYGIVFIVVSAFAFRPALLSRFLDLLLSGPREF